MLKFVETENGNSDFFSSVECMITVLGGKIYIRRKTHPNIEIIQYWLIKVHPIIRFYLYVKYLTVNEEITYSSNKSFRTWKIILQVDITHL